MTRFSRFVTFIFLFHIKTFIKNITSDPAQQDKIFRNPIYKILAKEFSGANEYMALIRLLELYETHEFDTIILDTPPSRNLFDFFDAPQLVSRFFEESMMTWLVMPANKVVAGGMKKVTPAMRWKWWSGGGRGSPEGARWSHKSDYWAVLWKFGPAVVCRQQSCAFATTLLFSMATSSRRTGT